MLLDLERMPNHNPATGTHGLRSVSAGEVVEGGPGHVACVRHGAMNAVNPERTIWRCLAAGCEAAAYRVPEVWSLVYWQAVCWAAQVVAREAAAVVGAVLLLPGRLVRAYVFDRYRLEVRVRGNVFAYDPVTLLGAYARYIRLSLTWEVGLVSRLTRLRDGESSGWLDLNGNEVP